MNNFQYRTETLDIFARSLFREVSRGTIMGVPYAAHI